MSDEELNKVRELWKQVLRISDMWKYRNTSGRCLSKVPHLIDYIDQLKADLAFWQSYGPAVDNVKREIEHEKEIKALNEQIAQLKAEANELAYQVLNLEQEQQKHRAIIQNVSIEDIIRAAKT